MSKDTYTTNNYFFHLFCLHFWFVLLLFSTFLLIYLFVGSLRDSSTSDDSLDSISTTIRCAAPHRPSGYLSEGESLFTANTTLPELSMAGKNIQIQFSIYLILKNVGTKFAYNKGRIIRSNKCTIIFSKLNLFAKY